MTGFGLFLLRLVGGCGGRCGGGGAELGTGVGKLMSAGCRRPKQNKRANSRTMPHLSLDFARSLRKACLSPSLRASFCPFSIEEM